jgi:hypothetical protein
LPRASLSRSHRFVVVWRAETREIASAAEVRRGWVERVPDPRAQAAGEAAAQRVGFHQLDELPAVIARLIADAEAGPAAHPVRRPRP